ncbi:hypothetical protein MMC13_002147 [Lambiella insularis]|nr:hypothetical protein [Lambiella insularis]
MPSALRSASGSEEGSTDSVEIITHGVSGTSLTHSNTSNSKKLRRDVHEGFLEIEDQDPTSRGKGSHHEEIKTAPLFSGPVLDHYNSAALPQYGLLGRRMQDYNDTAPPLLDAELDTEYTNDDDRIFLNANTPWSTFICGSQGSGKSHTLSCMLENCLLKSQIGNLPKPLSALVFHYDKFTSYTSNQICEAAYLCSAGLPVKVLVAPTNFWRMKAAYESMPGLKPGAKKPEVISLHLREQQLDVSRMMNLMAVKGKDGPVPLYIEVLHRVLREMAIESKGAPGLNYDLFRRKLAGEGFSRDQNGPLKLRLELLESFMENRRIPVPLYTPPQKPMFAETAKGRKAERAWEAEQERHKANNARMRTEEDKIWREAEASKANTWSFAPGSLTIVDLSCPFVDENAACALFTICLELFLETRGNVGRVIALDEAHKFMTGTDAADNFTENLLQVIRQQRHLATRVIIATQEPTISPKLLDLSSITIVHRFTSPDWFRALKQHLAGVSGLDGETERDVKQILRNIVQLEAGQALVFCPTAVLDLVRREEGSQMVTVAEKMGMAYIKMRVRKRLTADGGKSIMAV